MDIGQVGGTAGIILVLVQIAKSFVKDGRWWPVIGIVAGVAIVVIAVVASGKTDAASLANAALQGITSGLVASGVFSGVNAVRGR